MSNRGTGWALIAHSMKVFKAYPWFLVPMLGVWVVYASGVLYLKYDVVFAAHGAGIDTLVVLRAHPGVFGSGYALTYIASSQVFLPAGVVFMLGVGHHGHPPMVHVTRPVWVATIIYMGLAWSFSVYLEQMFMAQLYMWHMTWQAAVAQARQAGQPMPAFDSIPRPELLGKTPDLFAEAPS